MSKVLLGTTKNGFTVYVDMQTSHAASHLTDTPKLLDAVKQVIPELELLDSHVRIECNMGFEIGNSDLIETNDFDEIVYALRPNRTQYSRFAKNKKPQPTTWIVLDLRKENESQYALYTTFAGRLTPSFPGGDYLPEQSKKFWSTHALVWGTQEVLPGSETDHCPW